MGLARWSLFGLSFLLFLACDARRNALPELPVLATEGFVAPVREQIRSVRERAERDPADAGANGRLGMVLAAYGLSNPAAICFERAHLLDPTEFRWAYYLAVVYSDLGRTGEAVRLARQALAIRPQHLGAQLKLASWLLASDDLSGSRAVYEQVIARHPREVDAHYGLAQVLMQENRPADALERLRIVLGLNDRIGVVHYALAQVYRRLGDDESARFHARLFESYKENPIRYVDPLILEVSELNAGAVPHITRADHAMRQGRLVDAAASLEQAVEIDPGRVETRLTLMDLYARLDRVEEGRAQYESARELDPADPRPPRAWGEVQHRLGNHDQAVDALTLASRLEPDNARTRVRLGAALERLGDRDAALSQYRQALELDPRLGEAHSGSGGLLLARGEYAEAVHHLEEARRYSTAETPLPLYRLATAYEGSGRPGAAIATLRQARQLATETADVHLATKIQGDLVRLEAQGPGSNGED